MNDIQQVLCKILVDNREICYYKSMAKDRNRPILIILHGRGYVSTPAQFRSENWNVICPIDDFGENKWGSWFLGEKGDFFWIRAIRSIIEHVRQESGTGRLYFWGSSMGGYGAILHGYLNYATAVYANVPQTHLLGSTYSNNGMYKYFNPIFDNADCQYNTLVNVIKSRTRTKIFLCFNQLERSNYLDEQCFPFVKHLQNLRQKFYLEIRPIEGHGKNHGISESIALFNKFHD